jgi:hypothetical protein
VKTRLLFDGRLRIGWPSISTLLTVARRSSIDLNCILFNHIEIDMAGFIEVMEDYA